jgi:hypothetical protein
MIAGLTFLSPKAHAGLGFLRGLGIGLGFDEAIPSGYWGSEFGSKSGGELILQYEIKRKIAVQFVFVGFSETEYSKDPLLKFQHNAWQGRLRYSVFPDRKIQPLALIIGYESVYEEFWYYEPSMPGYAGYYYLADPDAYASSPLFGIGGSFRPGRHFGINLDLIYHPIKDLQIITIDLNANLYL